MPLFFVALVKIVSDGLQPPRLKDMAHAMITLLKSTNLRQAVNTFEVLFLQLIYSV